MYIAAQRLLTMDGSYRSAHEQRAVYTACTQACLVCMCERWADKTVVMALMAVGDLHPATASYCFMPSLQGCSLPFPNLQHLFLHLPRLLKPRTAVGAFALLLICTQSLESRPGDQELLPAACAA
jgi:hypothetical protein